MSPLVEETTPVWKTYLDLTQDVKPELQIDSTQLTYDKRLQRTTDMACWWVQNYLGKPVAPTQFFRRFSGYWGTGNGGSFIDLPYYPVLTSQTSSTYAMTVVEWWGTSGRRIDNCTTTINSATVADTSIQATDVGSFVVGPNIPGVAGQTILTVTPGVSFTMSANATASGATQLAIAQGHVLQEQTPSNQGTQDMYALEPLQGRITRAFLGLVPRPFFPGLRNIDVTWWAGYDPTPPDIMEATLQLINWWWRNTQESPRWFARTGYDEGTGASSLWPAVPNRVTTLLQPYVQVGIG
jgi:hypothetical protein